MLRQTLLAGAAAIALAGSAAAATPAHALTADGAAVEMVAANPALADNPVYAEWTGPYGGVPAWDQVRLEHFRPALEQAMADNLANIERIVANPEPPTFENTIAALEEADRALDRATTIYGVWASTMSSPEFRALQQVIDPMLAAHRDRITQNEALFRRIEAVYAAREALNPEQQRLTWLYWNNFVRSGAALAPEAKARVAEINQALAGLFTRFSQNLLADEETWIVLDGEEDLAGLPDSVIAGAAAAAAERGLEGKWVIVNTRSSVDPFLTYSTRRDLRERVWRAFVNRGDNGDEHDNNAIISEILQLRFERARLLGYETHAHWRLENAMARTPENAMALMTSVWPAAVARVREEVRDMQAIADAEGAGITIEPWDYRFYQEKVRKARYDLDQNEIKPYLELEQLREAMFWAAGQLYGWTFHPVDDAPVYHPDVRVWEVRNPDGSHRGLWYFDPYARPGKRSGAWMNAYRSQERFRGEVTTIVSNNSNFVKAPPGEPVLISWDDAETLFHEFGHAIHGLASNVTYPSLAGTAVSRDYVEFPSQLNESWLSTPEVLNRFARHHQTGEPMPQDLIDKIEAAATFNQGFATVEYLSSALIDMRLHLAGGQQIDPDAFEREVLAEYGMPDELVMRHRTPQFSHVFSSDGYSAGYYSYLWADTLTADAAEAFVEAGSFYDRETARRLHDTIMSVGNTIDPAEQFRNFRGRDPDTAALMRSRGFPVPGQE